MSPLLLCLRTLVHRAISRRCNGIASAVLYCWCGAPWSRGFGFAGEYRCASFLSPFFLRLSARVHGAALICRSIPLHQKRPRATRSAAFIAFFSVFPLCGAPPLPRVLPSSPFVFSSLFFGSAGTVVAVCLCVCVCVVGDGWGGAEGGRKGCRALTSVSVVLRAKIADAECTRCALDVCPQSTYFAAPPSPPPQCHPVALSSPCVFLLLLCPTPYLPPFTTCSRRVWQSRCL